MQTKALNYSSTYVDPKLTVLLGECERRLEHIERLAQEQGLDFLSRTFDQPSFTEPQDRPAFDSY